MEKAIQKYIIEAQKVLLPAGCEFDEERRSFIKNLTAGDLVAVPGSGKTTALQAKLFCLSKYLPFKDGSGILVLSHTNAAVEEVKKKLELNASHLFSYPCAVLTVQEFVDRFLALPYYTLSKETSITAIDGARYYDAVNKFLNQKKYKGHFVNAIYRDTEPSSHPFYIARLFYDKKQNKPRIACNNIGDELSIPLPKTWAKTAEEKKNEIKRMIIEMKKELMEQGILHYDDCYFLANAYISNYPKVIDYLRKRFPYVFVDETQDLKGYQLDLIDELFNAPEVILQRVGDHNQSIFSNGTEGDCEWVPRNMRTLENSLRLPQTIAKVVNPFMLSKTNIDGTVHFNVNGMQPDSMDLLPILVLYGEDSGAKLLEFYKKQIKDNGLDQHKDKKYGFYIVGWNASYPNIKQTEKKPRLEEIFTGYKHHSATRLNNRQSLSDYIGFIEADSSPKSIKEEILMAVCRAISLSGARNIVKVGGREEQRHYTPSSFSIKVKVDKRQSDEFDSIIYKSIISIREGNKCESYRLLSDYITNKAIQIVQGNINESVKAFVGDSYIESEFESIRPVVIDDEIPITITTVHSAKGQTHCATMYVETAFRSKFESEWLIETKAPSKKSPSTLKSSPFFNDAYCAYTDSAKKAMKMLYVGLSRPKHLLCYASQKPLWNDEMLSKMKDVGWRIYDTTVDAWLPSPSK